MLLPPSLGQVVLSQETRNPVSTSVNDRFVELMRDWLCSLPHDLRVLFEAKDDPNLERSARELATGAIMTVLHENAKHGEFFDYVDDAILVRQAMGEVKINGGEDAGAFCERFGEYFETLDDDLSLCKEVVGGDVFAWIAAKVTAVNKAVYKSKKVARYLDDEEDSELLYDAGLEFQTDYPVDAELLDGRLKKLDTLLAPIQRKAESQRR